MADTQRTLAALQTILADNTSGAISPQDVRDLLVSVFPDTDTAVQYVSKNGNDSNDGLSWSSAKLTAASAISALPSGGSGSTAHQYGRIYLGKGTFQETGPLECNAQISFIGSGSSEVEGYGTVMELADSSNSHLFAPTGSWDSYAHHVQFRDLCLSGNQANNAGSYDLLRIYQGGYNCILENVQFRDSPRNGLAVVNGAVSLFVNDCSFSLCTGNAVNIDASSTTYFSMMNSQIDDGGTSAIYYDHGSNTGAADYFHLRSVKFETSTAGQHDYCVHFKPRTAGGGHPVRFLIDGVYATQNGGGGTSVLYEESQSGHAAQWSVRNVNSANYTNAFNSAKTGQVSIETAIHRGEFGTDNVISPDLELRGMGIFSGTGSPETAITAPVGSWFMRSDGGAGTCLYVKESGTGNTGWIAK